MARGKSSGHSLYRSNVSTILGMQARGDRDHDIAAWFGVNQGRIAEAKDGQLGTAEPASADELPPKGPPGIKGRRLRDSVATAIEALSKEDVQAAQKILKDAEKRYDANKA